MIDLSGVSSFITALEKQKEVPVKHIRKIVETCVFVLHEGITERTPVWSGRSLRNWVWTMDQPNTQVFEEIDNGPPGTTSQMQIGSEPRRAPNQSASDKTVLDLSFRNPYRQFWLSNNSESIIDLEYGNLPTPAMSRQPAGMVRVTMQDLLLELRKV